MVSIGILTRNPSSYSTSSLLKAFRKIGVRGVPLRFRRFTARVGFKPYVVIDGVDILSEIDLLLVRPIGKDTLDKIIFRMDVLYRLSRLGLPVVNSPSTIEKCVDKYRVLTILEEAGLPVPRTVVSESIPPCLEALSSFGQAVLKPIFGSRGLGVARLLDAEASRTIFRGLQVAGTVIYVQEYVEHGNHDYRVLVVGGKIVGAMKRVSDGWKTNIAQGARAEAVKPTGEMAELALKSCEALGCEIAGVDILSNPKGELYITEVNSQPGWRGLQSVTSRDIAMEIAKYLVARAKR